MKPRVAVVGGGLLGLTAAYRLAHAGVDVTLYERSEHLGGLAGSFSFDGSRVDRFYHVVLPTDQRVRSLAAELGLEDRFHFRPTRVGFFADGKLLSLSSKREFLAFSVLRPHERARLAAFVVRCRMSGDPAKLDETPIEEWLKRQCGNGVWERLWRPLLDSKFDGRFDDLPATYIWSRTRRMAVTRDSSGAEVMGCLEGGYQTLVDALVSAIAERGGTVHAGTSVDRVVGSPDAVLGVVVGGDLLPFDYVLCTLPPLNALPLLDADLQEAVGPDPFRYLGVICLLLRLRTSVSPYYHLNITDRRVPLTTAVETTHVVDPDAVGGHLLYITKYVEPQHADHGRAEDVVAADYFAHAQSLFPGLSKADVVSSVLQRARVTEPVHTLGGARYIPSMFPLPQLALASMGHFYPEISSGQATIGVADRAAAGVLERLRGELRQAA